MSESGAIISGSAIAEKENIIPGCMTAELATNAALIWQTDIGIIFTYI